MTEVNAFYKKIFNKEYNIKFDIEIVKISKYLELVELTQKNYLLSLSYYKTDLSF